jgi:hypothetical protein
MAKKKKQLSKEELQITQRGEIENQIALRIDAEYLVGKANNSIDDADFESHMDMFDGISSERNYDWQSDVGINEFLSQQQIQSANEVNAQFSRTEFVEVDVQKKDDASIAAAEAAKETINNTLSRSDLYYFHKYLRMIQTKNITGRTYIRCWWEQDIRETTRKVERLVLLNVDELGNALTSPDQVPARFPREVDETITEVIKDQFNFEIIDGRNVFYSDIYDYNMKDKNWIEIRFDTTLQDLKDNQELMGYFNLDKIEAVIDELTGETETKEKTVDRDNRGNVKREPRDTPVKDLMAIERLGMEYAVVTKRDEDNEPIEIDYGYDETGERKESAELLSLIMTSAYIEDRKVLIRHQLNPYKDSRGNSYINIARGLCWIHPTRDRGFGDGHTNKDLQIAINDVYRADMDNTLLGLLKIIKVNKNAMEDQLPLRIEPNALWELDDPKDADVVDFPSKTADANNMLAMLMNKLQELNASDPGLPIPASATATAVARTEKATTTRSNYRNLVTENTLHFPLYWFILQMTDQFALPETAVKIMGEENVRNWNPDLDYIYKPVSEAIETDASRGAKIDRLNTLYGYTTALVQFDPRFIKILIDIYTSITKLMGDEEKNIVDKTLNIFKGGGNALPTGGQGGNQGSPTPPTGSPVQTPVNQTGLAQPSQEAQMIGSAL